VTDEEATEHFDIGRKYPGPFVEGCLDIKHDSMEADG
jgi:hypothetical protein